MFEKGYTGSNGRTDKRATGIGLYLCRRILAKLGHSIRIASTPGAGTTVRIGLEQDALEVEGALQNRKFPPGKCKPEVWQPFSRRFILSLSLHRR